MRLFNRSDLNKVAVSAMMLAPTASAQTNEQKFTIQTYLEIAALGIGIAWCCIALICAHLDRNDNQAQEQDGVLDANLGESLTIAQHR